MDKPLVNSFSVLAPLIIQKYENYLPTAFDESLSLLQKVNKVINWINTLSTDFTDVVDQWNSVITWVESDGLTDAVNTKLDTMVTDGTLTQLINQDVFDSINKKVDSIIYISGYTGIDSTGLTSSQTAIAQAVLDAFNSGKSLYWEVGTYLSTSNIPHLHEVRHMGEGAIKRGSNVFYLNPKSEQVNTIYMTPSGGVVGNDGLSSNESPVSLQDIFDLLPNYGMLLRGTWSIQLFAGNYSHAYLPNGLLSENPIQILGVDVGGHPNVPETFITDGSASSGSGLYCAYNSQLFVKNIKAINYSNGGNGLAASYGGKITTENVHTENNYIGITSQHQATITIPDGIHQNNTYGIYSLQQSNHYIGDQNATDVSKGAIIQNNTYGFCAKEFSTGHINYVTIQNNQDGIYLYRLASVNGDGILFKGNTRDVRQVTGGNFSPTPSTVFGSDSGTSVVNDFGFMGGTNYIQEYDMSYMSNERIVEILNYNNYIKTTTTTTFMTATLKTPHWKLDQNSFNKGKGFTFKIYGECDGSTDIKHIQVKITDGTNYQTAGISFAQSQNGKMYVYGTVYFLNQTDVFLVIEGNVHNMPKYISSYLITNLDKTKDLTLTLGGYVANVADSLKIDVAELRTFG